MHRAPLALTLLLFAGGSPSEPPAPPATDAIQQLLSLPAPPPERDEAAPAEEEAPAAEASPNDPWADASLAKLVVESKKAHEEEGGWVIGGDALEALARRDWATAEPIARAFMTSPQPRLRTAAMALVLPHTANEERARLLEQLRRLASDREQPGGARDSALVAVMAADWPGRDEWLVARMHDETLRDLSDGDMGYEPFRGVVFAAPDRLIPLFTKLLADSDRAVKSAAASALAGFNLESSRTDALRPLIPWIADPQWADDSGMSRLRLIQSVPRARLPEAIPALVVAVEKDPGATNREYAAESLAELHSTAGNAAMRKALEHPVDGTGGEEQFRIVRSLLATGGFAAEEIAQAVETFAAASKADRDAAMPFGVDAKLPPIAMTLGSLLAQSGSDREDYAAAVLRRAEQIAHTNRETAAAMLRIVGFWHTPAVDRHIVNALANGSASAEELFAALQRRDRLRANTAATLAPLALRDDAAGGVAAVLAFDRERIAQILAGGSDDARRGVVAAGRTAHEPLPLDTIAALRGKSSSLDAAIEAYLTNDDSREARAILASAHDGEARIYGLRSLDDPGHDTFGPFDAWETKLRQRVLRGECDEILALARASYWTGFAELTEIDVKDGMATAGRGPGARRPLPPETLSELRRFLADVKADDLPPHTPEIADGAQFEYVHITRKAGRRLFMNNPGKPSVYDAIVDRLESLAK
jgi:hypothetical protein